MKRHRLAAIIGGALVLVTIGAATYFLLGAKLEERDYDGYV